MIHLQALFFGKLRDLTEVRETGVVLEDGSRLTDLVSKLAEIYGQAFAEEVEAIQGLRILINGREYYLTGRMKSPLHEGDTIVFLPPIAGG